MNRWKSRSQSPRVLPGILQDQPILFPSDFCQSPSSPAESFPQSNAVFCDSRILSPTCNQNFDKHHTTSSNCFPDNIENFSHELDSSLNMGKQLEEIDFLNDYSEEQDNSGIWLTGKHEKQVDHACSFSKSDSSLQRVKDPDKCLEIPTTDCNSKKILITKSLDDLSYSGKQINYLKPAGNKVRSNSAENISPLPNLHNISERTLSSLEIPSEATKTLSATPQKRSFNQPHVIYITKPFLMKIAKTENLSKVTKLNLSLSSQWQGKIQYIENLDLLKNLKSLTLSHNVICKLQNMKSLTLLRYLDVSFNQLQTLEGIDSLKELEYFNISNNLIASIPKWLPKKLTHLKIFILAHNQISTLAETEKLSILPDLVELDVEGNSLCSLQHYRQKIIAQLCSLDLLNGSEVSHQERQEAHERFSQEEINQKRKLLEEKYKEIKQLKNENENFRKDKDNWLNVERTLNAKVHELKKSLRKNVDEINTKDQLLDSKTKELSKACEKQFKLEQELAFYKLDAKFADFLLPHSNIPDMIVEGVKLDESAYIGKATYTRHVGANEIINLTEEQIASLLSFLKRLNPEQITHNKYFREILETLACEKENQFDAQKQLKKKVSDLNQVIGVLETKIHDCEQNLQKKQEEVDLLNSQLTHQDESALEIMTDKLKNVKNEQEKLNGRLKELHAELDDANTKLINTYQEIRDLKNGSSETIKELKEHNKRLVAENLKLKKSHVGPTEELEKAKEAIAALLVVHENDKVKLNDVCNEKSKIKDELQREAEKYFQLAQDRSQFENNAKKKINQLQGTIEQLQNEIQNFEWRDASTNDVQDKLLSFIQGLTSDILHNRPLRNPFEINNEVLRSVLQNLKNSVADIISPFKEDMKAIQFKTEETELALQGCKKDLTDAQITINELKHEIDMKESNERVLNHELESIKEDMKENMNKHSSALAEYDDITTEMKNQIEYLDQTNEKLTAENKKLKETLACEMKIKSDYGNQCKSLKGKLQKQELNQKYESRESDKNSKLIAKLQDMAEDLEQCKLEAENLKAKSKKLLSDKENQHQKEMRYLLQELQLTKNCVIKAQHLDETKKNEDSCKMDEIMKSIQFLKNNLNPREAKEFNSVYHELKDIKSSLRQLQNKINNQNETDLIHTRIVDNIKTLEDKIAQPKDKGASVPENQNAKTSLLKALQQIKNLKDALTHKKQELKKSHVPKEFVDVQQREMKNLKETLNTKEKELKELYSTVASQKPIPKPVINNTILTERSPENFHSVVASTPIHQKYISENTESSDTTPRTNVYFHEHYLQDSSSEFPSSNQHHSFCNIEEHEGLVEQINDLEDTLLEGKLKMLSQGREDLRWELSRLEAKIGDAALQRSFSRRHNSSSNSYR